MLKKFFQGIGVITVGGATAAYIGHTISTRPIDNPSESIKEKGLKNLADLSPQYNKCELSFFKNGHRVRCYDEDLSRYYSASSFSNHS